MSEYDLSLERKPEAVNELLRKVSVLKKKRPAVHADVVHPGIAAAVVDPVEPKTNEKNQRLKAEFENA